MREVIFSATANRDLQAIWEYIAANSLDAADRFRDRLERAIRGLAEVPGKGHLRRDVRSDRYLFCSFENYVIAYRHTRGRIYVMRIVHGARDFTRIFRPRKKRGSADVD